jgi:hypothetical protein
MAEPDVKAPSGTVKIFGQSVSKKTLMIGGLIGAGVLGYAWYRKSKNGGSSTSAAADTSATAGIDAATGYPYGSAEDTAALSAQQDSGLDTNAGSDIDPETGYPYDSAQDLAQLGYTSGGGSGSGSGSTVTTIAQWEQECISNMQAGGVDAATLSAAEEGLPRYLAHLPQLSSADATAVQLAVGLTGPPPGGGTYNIIQPVSSPSPVSGTPATNKPAGTPPDVKVSVSGTTAHITWGAEGGEGGGQATSYNIQVTPKDASAHNIGNRTSYSVGGLKKNTPYQVHISAQNSAGPGPAGVVPFKT